MEEKNLSKGLRALTVEAERVEVLAVLNGKGEAMSHNDTAMRKQFKLGAVQLKRTFNQKTYDHNLQPNGMVKFWRVVGPATHKNYQSDLSLDGLREWGIVK